MKSVIFAAALCVISFPSAARACEYDVDLVRMPGETLEGFKAREESTYQDMEVIRRYIRETSGFKMAKSVYLARVVSSNAGKFTDLSVLPTAVVRPLLAVKGKLPAEDQTMSDVLLTSCGNYGDGEASMSTMNTLVFVFEGIPESKFRPRGVDSVRALGVRTYELLTPLYEFGTKAAQQGS